MSTDVIKNCHLRKLFRTDFMSPANSQAHYLILIVMFIIEKKKMRKPTYQFVFLFTLTNIFPLCILSNIVEKKKTKFFRLPSQRSALFYWNTNTVYSEHVTSNRRCLYWTFCCDRQCKNSNIKLCNLSKIISFGLFNLARIACLYVICQQNRCHRFSLIFESSPENIRVVLIKLFDIHKIMH